MIRVGQSYRRHPPQGKFDAIVIGSGVGGLTAAALLAKHAGKRVLVLERHYMPGGFTHVFRRRGYEWDVGVHYIGGMGSRRSGARRLFDHLSDGSLKWASMGDVYDRIILGDRSYDYVTGPDRFTAQMKQYFPSGAEAIDRYMEMVHKAEKASQLYFAEKAVPGSVSFVAGPLMRKAYLRYARQTTKEVLDSLTDDAELKGVLTGQLGDYGLPPSRSSFAMHAMLARHYQWGGFYPIGGASRIAAAIAPAIEAAGGEILFQADVTKIEVRGGRAVGVRMADDAVLEAPLVVSAVGVHNTYQRLLAPDNPETAASSKSFAEPGKSQASVSHLCLYVGFKQTADELGLPKNNLWIYPGNDHDASFDAYLADPEAPLPLVYVSFPSAKDPTFEERYPGRATIELITLAPFERFERWADTEWRKRGTEYEAV
ncbi:MAG: NAD(P)/FAD-dependent oxidoreductase, partial [Acidobacteriota bacterium]|nr:NAD(P)/FAD-dependent oxidoreductase [Acidobacteriota bacterium]